MKKFELVFFGLVVSASDVSAAEWTSTAGVAPAITYTDNVCLDPDNEQGELIGLLTPDVGIQGNGNRANVYLTANVELNTLTDSKLDELGCVPSGFGNRDQFAPSMDAGADAILVEDWLFIDANANIYQNSVSPFLAGGGDSLNRTGNTNTTSRYSISPYVSRRFKDSALLYLRYSWDEQVNSEDVVGDSHQERVIFSFGGVPGASLFSWGLQASYDHLRQADAGDRARTDSELSSAQLNLGYQLNRVLQINGYYGEERNDFVSSSDEIDGDFWDVGFRWTPNSRTSVSAGTGDRFFGQTPRFEIIHRHKHSEFTASYKKDLTYDRNIRELDNPGTGLPPNGSTTLSNSPILDERFTLGYNYTGRRSTMRLSASHSDQTRAEDGQDSTFSSASFSLDRSLSRQLTVTGGLNWSETDPRGDRSENILQSETWRFTLGAQRQLNQNTSISLDYQYTDRQSEAINNEYQENRLTLSLRYNL